MPCVNTLSTIERACDVTVGFEGYIYIAQEDEITSIPAAVNGEVTTDIVMEIAGTFKRIPISREPGKNKLNSDQEGDSDSGAYFSQGEFFVSGGSADRSYMYSGTKGKGFILLIPDLEGNIQIVGSKARPAAVKSNQVNDDQKGYRLVVEHRGKDLPYYYSGTITE